MSQFLGAIAANPLSAIQAAGEIFGGFGNALTLGPVTFQFPEVPTHMPIGVKQDIASHQLIGGYRTIDAMGPNQEDKTWEGYFSGQDALTRARLCEAMAASGQPVTLAWNVFSYLVLVTAFHCDTRLNDVLPYSITCTVIQDNSSGSGETLATLAEQVVADLATGQYVSALGAVSQGVVSGPLAAAGSAAGAPNATTIGSAAYTACAGAVNTAAGAINGAVASVNTTLAGYGTSLQSLSLAASSAANVVPAIGAVTGALGAASDMANLAQIRAYTGRAQVNIANASA